MKRLCLLIVTKKNENCPVLNIIFGLVIPACPIRSNFSNGTCLESFFECRKYCGQARLRRTSRNDKKV
jgi:hypothetical protein